MVTIGRIPRKTVLQRNLWADSGGVTFGVAGSCCASQRRRSPPNKVGLRPGLPCRLLGLLPPWPRRASRAARFATTAASEGGCSWLSAGCGWTRPRLRRKGIQTGVEVEVPVYQLLQENPAVGQRVLEILLRGVSTRSSEHVLPAAGLPTTSARHWSGLKIRICGFPGVGVPVL